MKNRILNLVMILSLAFLSSCSDTDDAAPIEALDGTWNLTNIQGGLAGINEDFASGSITWSFNNESLILTVENNSTQTTVYSGYPTGSYAYTIAVDDKNEYIIMNTVSFGSYVFSGNNLIINQNENPAGSGADGFILQFER